LTSVDVTVEGVRPVADALANIRGETPSDASIEITGG
jgi:hypothetical protein